MTIRKYRLNDDFLDSYKDLTPAWGFADDAGNSMGEITFLRSYSRLKDDGSKETWQETCQRVIEGMFTIQREWCVKNRLPWDYRKAQRTAQDAYDRMFHFKWLPPGRGIANMGAEFVIEDWDGTPLQNPLHVDTPVYTRDGWVKLGALAGMKDVEFLTSNFKYARDDLSNQVRNSTWAKGDVSEVELQPSYEIEVRDPMGNVRKIIASENHRWFARNARDKVKGWKRITTSELTEGDALPLAKPTKNYTPSFVGQQHGLLFGDGSRTRGSVEQFGDSIPILEDLFGDRVRYHHYKTRDLDSAIVDHLPKVWGKLPKDEYRSDKKYLMGFLSGYFAADGSVGKNGSCEISSARKEELAEVAELFASLGVLTTQPRLSSSSSNYMEERELWKIVINKWDLNSKFFLKAEHLRRWTEGTEKRERKEVKRMAVVKSIREVGEQPVLCATVPDYEQFVIDGFILTSNCAFVSTKVDYAESMHFLMLASMNGIGVGLDILGEGRHRIQGPRSDTKTFVVPDTREGWADALQKHIESYLNGTEKLVFDYSQVRPKGALIKRFGGTASGPEALEDLLNWITERLDSRIGSTLSGTDIADIANQIGCCVVSGSSRRSAELLLGPQTDEYMDLKNFGSMQEVTDENGVTTEQWVEGPAADRAAWAWMSNNSVLAEVGQDYSKVAKRTRINGEPGYVWMDTTRGFGRMKDRRDDKDHRAAGYNPCFTGDTMLMTENGWTSFYDAYLAGTKNRIVVDGRVSFQGDDTDTKKESPEFWKIDSQKLYEPVTMEASEVFLTQREAQIVKVVTSSGIEVRCTPDHLIATKNGMKRADELTQADRILITRGHLPKDEIGTPSSREEVDGFLMGLIAGDGHIARSNSNEEIYVDLWGSDREIAPQIVSWIEEIHAEFGDKYKANGNRAFVACQQGEREDRDQTRISSTFLAAYLKGEYGFTKASKRKVPSEYIDNATSRAARFYVAGLFFADGSIQLDKRGGGSIRLWQDNREILQDVQRILLANGIFGQVYLRRTAGEESFSYKHNNDAYELIINGGSFEFQKFVGFGLGRKQDLAASNFTKPSKKQAAFTQFVSCEDDGMEDVYCLQEPERRILSANGITARRCAEQPLESYEVCTLVETFPTRHDTIEDYLKTLKVAYLYAKTVTLLPTIFERTNAIVARNRRIGLSQSGITTYVEKEGIARWRELSNEGYKYIQKMDTVYSEWLCVRNSIRTTTVKPSGTVSILTGDSPGVHWNPAGGHYVRRVTMAPGLLLESVKEAGYHVEESVYSKGQYVVSFPIKSEFKRSENEVTIWEKVALAAEAQHWWSDNSVSVTVSHDPDTEGQHIEYILSLYEGRLKTVSFLKMDKGVYQQMPYEEITEEEYHKMCEGLTEIDRDLLYQRGEEAEGEKFCTTDKCLVVPRTDPADVVPSK